MEDGKTTLGRQPKSGLANPSLPRLGVEGRQALGLPNLTADQVSITYWYGREPQKSQRITYSQAWHDENWRELHQLITQIDALPEEAPDAWPLVPDIAICEGCGYRNYCGRFEAKAVLDRILEERDDEQAEKWADLAVMEPPIG